jgi:SAM-dependent methyltransferase
MSALLNRLQVCFDRVEPENIWRPVYDQDGILLADGHEDMRDGSPADLAQIDFFGKQVLDLGCNFGYYSFLTKRMGASSVVGIDIDEDAICGCRLLSRLYGFTGMEFQVCDLCRLALNTSFDCTLLINFIGKKSLCKGIVPILDIVRTHSRGDIILSARLCYNIPHSLQVFPERLVQLYGADYVREDSFSLVAFLRDFFGNQRQMTIISPNYADQTLKRTFLFTLDRQ